MNGVNLYNERRKANRQFMNKSKEYLRDKINVLATNSVNKNIRDLYIKKINLKGASNPEVT
jgi:hypothetical protein